MVPHEIHFESTGLGDPVLFIHAGVADSRMWNRQFEEVDGYRLIRFDMRGYGQTSVGSESFSSAEDALAVLDSLDVEDAVLVGCSIGAKAALEVCRRAAERIRGLVLVGADSPGFDPNIDYRSPEWPSVVEAYDAGDFDRVAELEGEIWLAGIDRTLSDMDPALVDLFVDMNLIGLANESVREDLEVFGSLESLPTITAPALVIVGDRDMPQKRAAAENLASQLTDGEFTTLENTAHLPSMEQPEAFNAALKAFLTQL